ncbi:MAG: DUF2298 domain-containing protein [Cellvibrionaceae bacterium]|nr:DUF2298 domain-containing protein [Cellvibrionaceae bacterium]
MYFIYTIFSLLFIWLSVAGVSVMSQKYIEDIAIARSVGLLLVVLVLFFVEHFVGLGKLNWLLPFTVLGGAWLLWKKQRRAGAALFWRAELVFVLAFLYGFFWRYSYPGISPSSEKITDLFFIGNYYTGETLPPLDNWNPPHLFDYYYAFQHYAAALLGRVFNLEIGVCFNISFALLAALPLTLAWSISKRFVASTGLRILLVCTLAFGGTGLSPILHLAYQSPKAPASQSEQAKKRYHSELESRARGNIIGGVRLIGGGLDNSRENDRNVIKPVADVLLPVTDRGDKQRMVLPAENFGYQFFLGDYHPSSGGFFLLVLALALIVSAEYGKQARVSQVLLAGLVPVMMITNTWTFPLLVLLIGGWLAFRFFYKKSIDWLALIGGGLAGTFLIYPFLIGFTANSLPTPIRFVNGDLHTPISRFLAMHWPMLLLVVFALFEKKYRRLSLTFAVTWFALLLISEFIYIDDPTGSQYQRTNSTMKWWGWIHTGVIVMLGALCLGSSVKWVRWATAAVFLCVNVVAFDLFRYWVYSGRFYQGKLAGHHWFTQTATNRMMFEFLKEAPQGIILERVIKNAYSNTSIYGVFNHKPVLLGWPSHLLTWHGSVPRVWVLKDEIDKFYKAELDDPLEWLASHNVEYVVFSPSDDNKKFDAINAAIKSTFVWHEFEHSRKRHTGIWVKVQ